MRFRPSRRPLQSGIRIAALLLLLWTIIEAYWIQHNIAANSRPATAFAKEKIFIASIHWNNEAILRSHWIDAVVQLTKELGAENVFVSVQESGSWDDSKGALAELDAQLEQAHVPRRVLLNATTHEDEIRKPSSGPGWIRTPRDKLELRRIPYLARLRNLVMQPLRDMKASDGVTYDKILFLNDVVFKTQDVRNLLATRDGNYAAACSLDFAKPPFFYDTFALRDAERHDCLMQRWPFFRADSSRRAVKANAPVPVTSCWNGMVVMDAAPFYSNELEFRGIPDSLAMQHLEGSECCLIHADNPLSRSRGVWVNPKVRVGYSGPAYDAVNPTGQWLSFLEVVRGTWQNRILRWFTTTWFGTRVVLNRLSTWQNLQASNHETGRFCLINEMQVLVQNGWAHL